jgi:hypothetical protein
MSSHEEQYQNWLRSQELKGRKVHLEGEIRNLNASVYKSSNLGEPIHTESNKDDRDANN